MWHAISCTLFLIAVYMAYYLGHNSSNLTTKDMNAYQNVSDGIAVAILYGNIIIFFVSLPKKESDSYILPVEDGYNRWASVYDSGGNAVIQVERRHTKQRLNELSIHGTIADIGCGTGHYTNILLQKADKVFAIDKHNSMLEQLRKNCPNHIVGNKLVVGQGTISNLQSCIPESTSIDGILCCLVIDHIEGFELNNVFQETYRILKPGGWLYITDVNPYFEMLEECYAKFIDMNGIQQRIRVYPHEIHTVTNCLKEIFGHPPEIKTVSITENDICTWEELKEKKDFPLIVEYYIKKNQ